MQPPEMPAPSTSGDGDPRVALLAAEVAARLRPVCQDWDEARFHTLVRRIARRKVQWDDALRAGDCRTDPHRADAPRADRLRAD